MNNFDLLVFVRGSYLQQAIQVARIPDVRQANRSNEPEYKRS